LRLRLPDRLSGPSALVYVSPVVSVRAEAELVYLRDALRGEVLGMSLQVEFCCVGLLIILGRMVNLLFPEWAIKISRNLLALMLDLDRKMPDVFFSIEWCRFGGVLALLFVLGVVILCLLRYIQH
jgi:hypothetical protein